MVEELYATFKQERMCTYNNGEQSRFKKPGIEPKTLNKSTWLKRKCRASKGKTFVLLWIPHSTFIL